MAGKRHKPEEIVAKLRLFEVLQSQGASTMDAIRQIGITEVTYYRWRKEYGGTKAEQLRRQERGGLSSAPAAQFRSQSSGAAWARPRDGGILV